MNFENEKLLLEKYSTCCGVSGNEKNTRDLLIEDLKKYSDNIEIDNLGNLITYQNHGSNEKTFMIAAHMDEIGLMVKYKDDNGFIKFITIGGWFDQTLLNQRVILHSTKGNIVGVIGSKPPHVMTSEDLKSIIKKKDMFIDIGAKNKDEVYNLGIEIGTYITLDRTFESLINNRVTCKSFDNRAGIVVLIEVMKRLKDKNLNTRICGVGTVQEEVGLKGARTATNNINPDGALAVDTTIPGDHPGISKEESILELGKGPVITVVDASGRGLITNSRILSLLVETGKNNKIQYQLDVGDGGTTDATAIQLSNNGIPTGVVSIPTRYIHSPVEVLDLEDLHNAIELIVNFIVNYDKNCK